MDDITIGFIGTGVLIVLVLAALTWLLSRDIERAVTMLISAASAASPASAAEAGRAPSSPGASVSST